MSEGAVRLGHAVTIFLLLEGGTSLVISIDNFSFETLRIRHTLARTSGLDEPRESEVLLTVTRNWEWNLIVSTTNAARFYFEIWRNVSDSFLENSDWIFAFKLLSSAFKRLVNGAFSV